MNSAGLSLSDQLASYQNALATACEMLRLTHRSVEDGARIVEHIAAIAFPGVAVSMDELGWPVFAWPDDAAPRSAGGHAAAERPRDLLRAPT